MFIYIYLYTLFTKSNIKHFLAHISRHADLPDRKSVKNLGESYMINIPKSMASTNMNLTSSDMPTTKAFRLFDYRH